MTLNAFIEKLSTQPELIEFTETMAVIESHYDFTPTEFANGNTVNLADQNNGSCKIFAFALLNQLKKYRHDVLENPQGDDHQN
ncbi:HopJ type III effector protein, partial [Aliivibrio fischeri]|uniref:HopJ type III effector protein n=1 Tax=Aliivibrio fischeri TaxID=668 RepID=UPI00358DBCFF